MLLGLCLPLLVAFSPAQDTSAQAPAKETLGNPFSIERGAMKRGEFLPPYLELVRQEEAYRASERWSDAYLQARAGIASYLGEVDEADRLYLQSQGYKPGAAAPLTTSPLAGYRPTDAEAFLLRAAERHRVLMVNEAHHAPQTRVLTTRLLRGLWKRGYRYLALETFEPRANGINRHARAYPLISDGTMTVDPIFGDEVRQALELGFTLVAYEIEIEGPAGEAGVARANRRDAEEARLLKERIFDRDPKAKVLVHAGYQHISEVPLPGREGEEAWIPMAMRLRQLTGIDPYTVDMQRMMPHAYPTAEPAAYRQALASGALGQRPVVFTTPQGAVWTGATPYLTVDAQVFLPAAGTVEGRPDWMARDLGRRPCAVPAALRDDHAVREVAAYFAIEPENTVPVDRILVQPGQKATLMLPRRKGGRFRLVARNVRGIIATTTVRVR